MIICCVMKVVVVW